MNILIAGASGFIGSELVKTLSLTHKITVLGRNKKKLTKNIPEAHKYHDWDELESVNATRFDAIINLCGENIAAPRWTKKIKKNLINSRIKTNGTLINWLIRQKAKPHFICANAIGIYGVQENGDMDAFDENSQIDIQKPKDFLSEICIKWEIFI